MKSLILIIALSLCQMTLAAGVDHSGGGLDMPMVSLNCQGGTQIQFREFFTNNGRGLGAQPILWITYPEQAQQTIEAPISRGPGGSRIFTFGDFYCTRKLIEQNKSNWELLSSCEGKQWAIQCSRSN